MLLARSDAELEAGRLAEERWTALSAHLAAKHIQCLAACDAVIAAGNASSHALVIEVALAPGNNAVMGSAAEALADRLTQDLSVALALCQQAKKTAGRLRATLCDEKEEWQAADDETTRVGKRLRLLIAQSEHRLRAPTASVRGMDDADDIALLSELQQNTRKHLTEIKQALADDDHSAELVSSCDDLLASTNGGAALLARLGELNAALDEQRTTLEAQRSSIAGVRVHA